MSSTVKDEEVPCEIQLGGLPSRYAIGSSFEGSLESGGGFSINDNLNQQDTDGEQVLDFGPTVDN